MRFKKGEKSSAKYGLELGSIALKNMRLIYTAETDVKSECLFAFLTILNTRWSHQQAFANKAGYLHLL